MKWFLIVLFFCSSPFFFLPGNALAITADQHASDVIQKDLPRSLQWFEKITGVTAPTSVELRDLYNAAIPAPQQNWQNGISIKGSIERMLLLLEGARFFPAVSEASPQFQADYEFVVRVLQAAKDQTEHFRFGESAEILYEQWQQVGVTDFPKFASTLTSVLNQVQMLLKANAVGSAGIERIETPAPDTALDAVSDAVSDSVASPEAAQAITQDFADESFQDFDVQRFFSYIEASEKGRVAPECEAARTWSTDQAPRCTRDDEPGCNRNYARQCKKLQ